MSVRIYLTVQNYVVTNSRIQITRTHKNSLEMFMIRALTISNWNFVLHVDVKINTEYEFTYETNLQLNFR